jgi:hypothetical protein
LWIWLPWILVDNGLITSWWREGEWQLPKGSSEWQLPQGSTIDELQLINYFLVEGR